MRLNHDQFMETETMNNTRKLKVGLIGLGGVAQEHMRAYAASDKVDMVAGADIDTDRGRQAAEIYGLTPYLDYQRMLSSEALDVVCVLTPPTLHRSVVESAAEHKLHILCEKPLAASMDDALAMKKAVDRAGVKFLYGASYRYLPAINKARELIAEGAIGSVRLCIEILVGGKGSDNVRTLSSVHYPDGGPGGTPMGLVDHGIHLADTFYWLTGFKTVSAFGYGNIAGVAPEPETAMLTLENGATALLVYDEATFSLSLPSEGIFSEGAGWNINGYTPAGGWDDKPCMIEVYGTKGALRIYPYANVLYTTTADGISNIPLNHRPYPNHFKTQMDSFTESIRQDNDVIAGIDEGISALKTILAIYESVETRCAVDMHAAG